ncbi:hypothetical protein [Ralstonia sp. UBA689]|uniref:hypothetical protein n=1 Tax=Ralstonia sp. UBA689 TaxID=1947373 RepID=UPI0025EB1E7A|nr:hypothetical protein [Ralstonia sp. UBA689]
MWFVLLLGLNVVVFSLPLVPAALEWKRRSDVDPLQIDAEHTLDVKAVASEFRAMLERRRASGRMDGALDALGRVVTVVGLWAPTPLECALQTCSHVIAARGRLILRDNFVFTHAMYATRGVTSGRENHLQAVLAEGDLLVCSGSVLHRWAYARSAHIQSHCRLQGPLSAQQQILIEEECRFSSLMAGSIYFGAQAERARRGGANIGTGHPHGINGSEPARATTDSPDAGRRIVEGDCTLPADSYYVGDLVVHGNLCIGSGAWVTGSVKAAGSMWLGHRVHIGGALVCERELSIATECDIVGPVIAELSIHLGSYCVIGAPSRQTSLVAPEVCISAGATVHGAVSALDDGRVVKSSGEPA